MASGVVKSVGSSGINAGTVGVVSTKSEPKTMLDVLVPKTGNQLGLAFVPCISLGMTILELVYFYMRDLVQHGTASDGSDHEEYTSEVETKFVRDNVARQEEKVYTQRNVESISGSWVQQLLQTFVTQGEAGKEVPIGTLTVNKRLDTDLLEEMKAHMKTVGRKMTEENMKKLCTVYVVLDGNTRLAFVIPMISGRCGVVGTAENLMFQLMYAVSPDHPVLGYKTLLRDGDKWCMENRGRPNIQLRLLFKKFDDWQRKNLGGRVEGQWSLSDKDVEAEASKLPFMKEGRIDKGKDLKRESSLMNPEPDFGSVVFRVDQYNNLSPTAELRMQQSCAFLQNQPALGEILMMSPNGILMSILRSPYVAIPFRDYVTHCGFQIDRLRWFMHLCRSAYLCLRPEKNGNALRETKVTGETWNTAFMNVVTGIDGDKIPVNFGKCFTVAVTSVVKALTGPNIDKAPTYDHLLAPIRVVFTAIVSLEDKDIMERAEQLTSEFVTMLQAEDFIFPTSTIYRSFIELIRKKTSAEEEEPKKKNQPRMTMVPVKIGNAYKESYGVKNKQLTKHLIDPAKYNYVKNNKKTPPDSVLGQSQAPFNNEDDIVFGEYETVPDAKFNLESESEGGTESDSEKSKLLKNKRARASGMGGPSKAATKKARGDEVEMAVNEFLPPSKTVAAKGKTAAATKKGKTAAAAATKKDKMTAATKKDKMAAAAATQKDKAAAAAKKDKAAVDAIFSGSESDSEMGY